MLHIMCRSAIDEETNKQTNKQKVFFAYSTAVISGILYIFVFQVFF